MIYGVCDVYMNWSFLHYFLTPAIFIHYQVCVSFPLQSHEVFHSLIPSRRTNIKSLPEPLLPHDPHPITPCPPS